MNHTHTHSSTFTAKAPQPKPETMQPIGLTQSELRDIVVAILG
ncbi:hypothetical protein [Roseococcus pinisoli]|nr:hypothetical protein [Roseococcus pinisoli]